jgi:hypothetical protein
MLKEAGLQTFTGGLPIIACVPTIPPPYLQLGVGPGGLNRQRKLLGYYSGLRPQTNITRAVWEIASDPEIDRF